MKVINFKLFRILSKKRLEYKTLNNKATIVPSQFPIIRDDWSLAGQSQKIKIPVKTNVTEITDKNKRKKSYSYC